jgi:hypothetical protein
MARPTPYGVLHLLVAATAVPHGHLELAGRRKTTWFMMAAAASAIDVAAAAPSMPKAGTSAKLSAGERQRHSHG